MYFKKKKKEKEKGRRRGGEKKREGERGEEKNSEKGREAGDPNGADKGTHAVRRIWRYVRCNPIPAHFPDLPCPSLRKFTDFINPWHPGRPKYLKHQG